MRRLVAGGAVLALAAALLAGCGRVDGSMAAAVARVRGPVQELILLEVAGGNVMLFRGTSREMGVARLHRQGARWIADEGATGAAVAVDRTLRIAGGGTTAGDSPVGWVYGEVLDPRVSRVVVEWPGRPPGRAKVEHGAFLAVTEGDLVPFGRVTAYDAAGHVLASRSVAWGAAN